MKKGNLRAPGFAGKKSLHKEAHTSSENLPMGTYYGMAVRQKVGRMRDGSVGFRPATPKQLGTPPKALA